MNHPAPWIIKAKTSSNETAQFFQGKDRHSGYSPHIVAGFGGPTDRD